MHGGDYNYARGLYEGGASTKLWAQRCSVGGLGT